MHIKDDTGMVTAEAAVLMPVFAFLAFILAWATVAGIWQLRLEDAARTITRSATMHISDERLKESLEKLIPNAALVTEELDDDFVSVTITRVLPGPGLLPQISQAAKAVGKFETR